MWKSLYQFMENIITLFNYAFLVSLMNNMDQIQLHPCISPCLDNFRFESLREKVDFLVYFLDNHLDAIIPEKVDFLVDADSRASSPAKWMVAALALMLASTFAVDWPSMMSLANSGAAAWRGSWSP